MLYVCACVCHITRKLLQQSFIWSACHTNRQSATCFKCCCEAGMSRAALLSRYTLFARAALATGQTAVHCKILIFTFKTIHGKSPVYLQELISITKPGAYRLKSSSNGLLLEPPSFLTRATLGDRSFQVAAPKLWNALSHEIHSISNINTFKRHLKTHLFSNAFLKS